MTVYPTQPLQARLRQLICRAEQALTEAGFTAAREPKNPYQSHITDYGQGYLQGIITATVPGSVEVFEVSVMPDVHSADGFFSNVKVFDQGPDGWGFHSSVAEHTPNNVDFDPLRTVIDWMVGRAGIETSIPSPVIGHSPGMRGPGIGV